MPITVKRATLWRASVANKPGMLAHVLEPLAEAGADLRVVMGYGMGQSGTAIVEVFPVAGKKAVAAASGVGLSPSGIPCLLVEGDNRPGLGAQMTRAIADGGVNISFLIAETVGRKFSAVLGFDDEQSAAAASKAINAGARAKRKK